MKNNLKLIRKNLGLTQGYIADELCVETSQISKLERGKTKLHSEWIRKLTLILDCTASELLGEHSALEGGVIDDAPSAPSEEVIMEIMRQVYQKYPDAPEERIILYVGKIYGEFMGDLNADPDLVRAYFRFKDLSNLL